MWKLSQFTVAQNLADQGLETHVLVFNTHSGQCVLMPETQWSAVLDGLARDASPTAPVADRLGRGGILIDADVDERSLYEDRFDRRRYNAPSIFPVIAVTSSCNIGCTYCYEEGVHGEKMSDAVVAATVAWFERRIRFDGVRAIHPSLFGGEPLMYPRLLFALMDGLREVCDRHAVELSFTSSSNGMLLKEELAQRLAERGLSQIQISLDGAESYHDERRIGKRGQPTFRKSLAGIRTAAKWIDHVSVKINFDRHNRDSVAELYDFLIEEGLARRVDIKLETVAYQLSSKTVHDRAHVISPQSPELADAYLQLIVEAQQRGLRVNRETAHTTPCVFTSHNGVVIGPDGAIHKCISLVGRKDFTVGTVFDDEYDQVEYARQMDTVKRTEECWEEKCAYIPVCAGGCQYESIVRTGDYTSRFCTKPYLERWHYKKYFLEHEERLRAAGARPLSAEDLRASARAAAAALPKAGAGGCGGGGGCGSRRTVDDAPLLQILPMAGR